MQVFFMLYEDFFLIFFEKNTPCWLSESKPARGKTKIVNFIFFLELCPFLF